MGLPAHGAASSSARLASNHQRSPACESSTGSSSRGRQPQLTVVTSGDGQIALIFRSGAASLEGEALQQMAGQVLQGGIVGERRGRNLEPKPVLEIAQENEPVERAQAV